MINQACPQRYASLLARCEFQAPQRSRCMGAEEVRTEGCLFIGQRGLSLLCATLRVNQTARGSPINDFMSGPVTHFTVFECSKYPRVLPVKKKFALPPRCGKTPFLLLRSSSALAGFLLVFCDDTVTSCSGTCSCVFMFLMMMDFAPCHIITAITAKSLTWLKKSTPTFILCNMFFPGWKTLKEQRGPREWFSFFFVFFVIVWWDQGVHAGSSVCF